jgi:general secretion pathway protein A
MYTQFFRLNQAPFSIAPDPRYLFMSERHREALAHLLYGINSGGGFVLLTGEIGAGKTTICRCFLEQIPANCHVGYIFNPKLTVNELLKSICDEFGVGCAGAASIKDYVDALNRYLLATHAEGQNNVLIIDEAQNLSADVLEQLRLLTNLETNERKLLQIILIGQPELRAMLARPELKQLAQRVIARYHLESLSASETARYIQHRLAIAGLTTAPPIQAKLTPQIHQLTQGIPRRINLLCDRALLGAYAENKQAVDRNIVKKAAREVFADDDAVAARAAQPWLFATAGLLVGAVVVGAMAWVLGASVPIKTVRAEKPTVGTPAANVKKTPLPSEVQKPDPVAAQSAARAIAPESPATLAAPASDGKIDTSLRDADAVHQLAALWHVVLPEGDPCAAAQKMDLHCYKSNSGLAEVRQLDRPAILTLRDEAGKIFYAIVTGINNSSATVHNGSTTQTVSLNLLGKYFQGEFMTLWQAPQNFRPSLHPGERGADVDWLATQLTKLNGLKGPEANLAYDPALAKLVRNFQAAQGLKVDGIVGPKTYMLLNRTAGVQEPALQVGATVVDSMTRK